ncbi:MAG: hypothetical protein KC561_19335, partial [Myxococcales bacterium]|nr:hypothetical protein [Myxococcales bacterium]
SPVLYRDYTLAYVLVIAGGVGLMVLATWLVARSRPREVFIAPPPPPRPAHEVALEKLDELSKAGLIERGDHMIYFVRLSEAVREYLGRRYGFDGLDMTTSEILSSMRTANLPTSLGPHFVRQLLFDCDMVKFAKFAPELLDHNDMLASAYRLVKETTNRADLEEYAKEGTSSASPSAPSGSSESKSEGGLRPAAESNDPEHPPAAPESDSTDPESEEDER